MYLLSIVVSVLYDAFVLLPNTKFPFYLKFNGHYRILSLVTQGTTVIIKYNDDKIIKDVSRSH